MEEIFVKDLAKVKRRGYALESVLAVDDSPEKLRRHYGNLVRVRPWEGEPTDDELRRLSEYLVELRGAANFRAIDKRGWNLRAAHPDASRLQEGDAYPSR
jgi:RNA polymerase II subunit A small phosphatase-like protein